MITIKMWGGLGNQMFQYAFGYALKEKREDSVSYDTLFYADQPQNVGRRSVKLTEYFEVSDLELVERSTSVKIMENRYVNKGIRFLPISHFYLPHHVLFVKERKRTYMENLPYKKGWNNYYDGYWLTEKYFLKYADEINNQYTLKPEIKEIVDVLNANIEEKNSVSVHIRRGDYLVKKNMPAGYTKESLEDYYDRSIKYMQEHLNAPIFYFFSDDIEWCKKHFSQLSNAVYVSRKTQYGEIADLFGICKCEHGIMSASTFSWWGNWLRRSVDSLVIYPSGNYANDQFGCEKWIGL